jgi:hypothetical protein
MLKFSGFHFKKPALLTLAVLGLALISINASAQSETEKEGEHLPKANDRVVLEDNTLLQDNISSPIHTAKPSTTVKSTTSPVAKRDLPAGGVDKEVKKNESPSTLSFNIFLYIVDKFKAD